MDHCDEAQQAADIHLQDALAKVPRPQESGPGPEKCVDCGKVIPEKRRQAQPGCERCVTCQQAEDDYRKWRGNG